MSTPLGDVYRLHYADRPIIGPADPFLPTGWEPWLRTLFPRSVVHGFADRHVTYWEWLWEMEPDSSPDPFIGIWPRGGAKTTSAELGVAALGLRGKRKYVLYVRDTQDRADDSVGNIATLLESAPVTRYYPQHAEKLIGKHGNSRGWRRNRLRTAGGLTVDAIGLDTAARGAKLEDQRPDLIVFDDLDGKLDSPATTAKKIATLTTSLLPAGATNVAVLGIQNLIIPDGIFTRMADGRADYLARRIVSGPFPAVRGLVTEFREDLEAGTRRAVIIAGEATWDGQNITICQKNIDDWGLSAFLKEAQHEVTGRAEGVALAYDERLHPEGHAVEMTDDEVRALVRLGKVFGGIDFGAWRFAFTLWAVDQHNVPYRIAEAFSQRENLAKRATDIHDLCLSLGIKKLTIWGDAANPQDIMEMNAAWAKMGSGIRVAAVASENKIRATSVERLNRLLVAHAIRFRTLGGRWQLGWNAGSAGIEVDGSRLEWEMQHWAYPIPKEGIAQAQDPDDNTADGADMIASMRYAIMSWWKAPSLPAALVDPMDPKVMEAQGNPTLGTLRKLMRRDDLRQRLTRL